MMTELLKKLAAVPGTPGDEYDVSALISELIAPYTDVRFNDPLGSLICLKKGDGTGRKLMFCAHMDEPGFIVTFIESSGILRVAPIGSVDAATAAYSRVVFKSGAEGVLVPDDGLKASDWRVENFGIDTGAKDGEEAARQVAIGDRCRFAGDIDETGNGRVCGRLLESRAGCAALIEAAKKIASRETVQADDVYYVFAVQSELGGRGAGPAAFTVAPDLSVTFGTAPATDAPGSKQPKVKLGAGAAIKVRDHSVICDPGLVGELSDTARRCGIPFQYEIRSTGANDASQIQASRTGVRSAALSIPVRYARTQVETADTGDIRACADLAAAFVK